MKTKRLQDIESLQKNQRKLILNIVISIILIGSTLLGFLNIRFETWTSVIALFGLALFCIPLLILNSMNHYSLTAILLCVIVLLAIDLSIFDGDGILDSGILAIQMFILFGALLLGKRYVAFFWIASIVSLFLMVYFEMNDYIHPTIHPARYSDLYGIIILLSISSLLVWVIVNNYERNLDRVKDSNIELFTNYNMTIEAMAKVLEYRDLETAGHSNRVVQLSIQLARLLGCSEDEIEHLKRGAMLHDIGKLAIPDSILLKPDKLNESEIKIMQKHPEFGKEILSGISFLEPVIPIVYHHHERWDGTGYPQGLKGEQIPLFARVFSIVDAWDALNSDRPYRSAWQEKDVIKYIKQNVGSQFDPTIASLFLDIVSPQPIKQVSQTTD